MHGTYGLLWYLKHLTFPDSAFERHQTITCAIVSWMAILGPYWMPGYLLASGQCKTGAGLKGNELQELVHIYGSVIMYILGVSLMMTSDCQKTVILENVK